MEASELVKNGSALVEAMGYWPSFHDANVLEVSGLDDSFTVTIHLFKMTDQVNSAGYYVLEKRHLVKLTMREVQSNSLAASYATDCLDQLSFRSLGTLLQIDFDSHMDQGGTVICGEAEIVSIVPCTGEGVPLAPNNSFKPNPLRGSA